MFAFRIQCLSLFWGVSKFNSWIQWTINKNRFGARHSHVRQTQKQRKWENWKIFGCISPCVSGVFNESILIWSLVYRSRFKYAWFDWNINTQQSIDATPTFSSASICPAITIINNRYYMSSLHTQTHNVSSMNYYKTIIIRLFVPIIQ